MFFVKTVLLELPKCKKRRRLLTNDHTLYLITDLFCVFLDHIPLMGVNVDHMIRQQLYYDILQPLLTHLPTIVSVYRGLCTYIVLKTTSL